MTRHVMVLAMVTATFLTACSNPIQDKSTSLTPETKEWLKTSDGYFQYYTNETKNYDRAIWQAFNSTNATPLVKLSGSVKKMSGSEFGGFGVVFCYKDQYNFYTLLLSTNGKYSIQKIQSGIASFITDWTIGTHLNSGYGIENTFEITRSASDGKLSIFINGKYEDGFIGDMTGGNSGFILGVDSSENEHFPNTPVDVRFKLTGSQAVP